MESIREVWVVQDDHEIGGRIIGVFATQEKARNYAEHVLFHHKIITIVARFKIGYKFDQGTGFADYVQARGPKS